MDFTIGAHLKFLWNCQMTAICIYKLSPESSFKEVLCMIDSIERELAALQSTLQDVSHKVHLKLDFLLCL